MPDKVTTGDWEFEEQANGDFHITSDTSSLPIAIVPNYGEKPRSTLEANAALLSYASEMRDVLRYLTNGDIEVARLNAMRVLAHLSVVDAA